MDHSVQILQRRFDKKKQFQKLTQTAAYFVYLGNLLSPSYHHLSVKIYTRFCCDDLRHSLGAVLSVFVSAQCSVLTWLVGVSRRPTGPWLVWHREPEREAPGVYSITPGWIGSRLSSPSWTLRERDTGESRESDGRVVRGRNLERPQLEGRQ